MSASREDSLFVLALMDHLNIANVLDAGTTSDRVAAGILPAVEPGFQPGGQEGVDFISEDIVILQPSFRSNRPGGKRKTLN